MKERTSRLPARTSAAPANRASAAPASMVGLISKAMQAGRHAPMGEGMFSRAKTTIKGALSLGEVEKAFEMFFPERTCAAKMEAFTSAQRQLEEFCGGCIALVYGYNRVPKVAIRMEFPTSDTRMNSNFVSSISGTGFKAGFTSLPSRSGPTEYKYIVTEDGRTSDLDRISTTCEDLLKIIADARGRA